MPGTNDKLRHKQGQVQMTQEKKNSTRAQAISDLNTEAAIRFLHSVSSKNEDSGPIDKDGTGGGFSSGIYSFQIEIAINGFFVSINYLDPEILDERYIVETIDEVFELVRAKF
jgi:hypothetical protein